MQRFFLIKNIIKFYIINFMYKIVKLENEEKNIYFMCILHINADLNLCRIYEIFKTTKNCIENFI